MDLSAGLPLHGLKAQNLKGCCGGAGGGLNTSFRPADGLAQIIDTYRNGVITTGQVGKCVEFAILPNGSSDLKVSSKAAEVFAVRIWLRGFGENRDFAETIRTVGCTIAIGTRWSSECKERRRLECTGPGCP